MFRISVQREMKASIQSAKRCWSLNKLGGEIFGRRFLNSSEGIILDLPVLVPL